MAKFNNLYKRDLKNAQHFAFIQAFITVATAAGFTAQKIVAKLAELVTAFSTEDHFYMQFRASEIIAQRTAADTRRDNFYARLHRLIQAWAGSGMTLLDAAATALLRIFDLYKVKVSAQIDEQTGQMENLITDLSTPEMQANLQTINGMYLFTAMKAGQDDVKALRLLEGTEMSEKVMGALASARAECDRLYDELTAIIEGASLFADNPTAYEAFIRQWNGTLKIYQDMLDRKSGNSTSGTANPDGTGASPDPSQGGENGGQQTGGDNNQGSGTGTIDTGGGASPSPSQGGENGGGTTGGDNGGSTGGGDNGGGTGSIVIDNPENDGGD